MVQNLQRAFVQRMMPGLEKEAVAQLGKALSQASDALTAKGVGDDAMKTMKGTMTPRDFAVNTGASIATGSFGLMFGRMSAMPFTGPAAQTMNNYAGTMGGLFATGAVSAFGGSGGIE